MKYIFSTILIGLFLIAFQTHAQDAIKIDDDRKIYFDERIDIENITKKDLFELVQYWYEETLINETDTIRLIDEESSVVNGVLALEYPIRSVDEPFLNFIEATVYDSYVLIHIDDIKTFYTETPLEQYLLRSDGNIRDEDLAYEVENHILSVIEGIKRYIDQNKI